MGRLRVQYCVVNHTTRQYGPHPTSDLLGVDYFRTVPADTEFPRTLGKLELFVRFVGDGRIGGRVRVTVSQLHEEGSDRRRVYLKEFDLLATVAPGVMILDQGFKLINVHIPGEGPYAVRVMRRIRRPWKANPGWRVLAADYFRVTRDT